MQACVVLEADWREPLDVAAAAADEPYALTLLSDGSPEGRNGGGWGFRLYNHQTILLCRRRFCRAAKCHVCG